MVETPFAGVVSGGFWAETWSGPTIRDRLGRTPGRRTCAVDKEGTGPWRQRADSADTSGTMAGALVGRWFATDAAVLLWADGSAPAGCDAPRATDGDGVRADFRRGDPRGVPSTVRGLN
jgi:hypothetical protein